MKQAALNAGIAGISCARGVADSFRHSFDPVARPYLRMIDINQPGFLATLKQHAEHYLRDNQAAEPLNFLRGARYEVARAWLVAKAEELPRLAADSLGPAHITIMSCGMRIEPLSTEERRFAEDAARPLRNGLDQNGAYNNLLACMLYLDGYETDVRLTDFRIPPWLLPYVMAFLFYRAKVLIRTEETERFNSLYHDAIQAMHATLFDPGKNEAERKLFLQTIVMPLFQRTSLTLAYFGNRSLREECVLRAEMLEYSTRAMGFATERACPPRTNGRRIRLGILRPHFDPSTETYATLPVFEHLDRGIFEIILYTERVSGSPLERYCASRADRLTDLSLQGLDAVSTIRSDDLDILFIGTNLSARPKPNMLALHRLARFQVISFCEPATSGIRNIDYYLAGELALPSGDPACFYSERLLTMSGSGICFSYGSIEQAAIPAQRSQLGIPDDAMMYVSGANMVKLSASLCESWAEILSAVPGSILVLYPFNPNWLLQYPIASFTRELHVAFLQCGIAKERVVVLEPRNDFAHIRSILELADVYLDGYPYSGATSVADALQARLPTVALEGRYLRFRQAAAILREMQLHELVAVSEEDYRKIAIGLGHDMTLREKFRGRIQEKLGQKNNFLDSAGYSEKVAKLFSTLINEGT